MKRNRIKELFGFALFGLCFSVGPMVLGQPMVQVVWEAPASRPLLDRVGRPLPAGLSVAGDGALVELGYYDAGSTASPFQGKFLALTGLSSAVASPLKTSIGDTEAQADGTFSLSTNFKEGAAVFQGDPPEPGTPLVIRFYDGTTPANSKYFNAVSGGANWLWKAPTEAPGAFVILSLADSDLVWQGGATSAFKTALAGPPPEKNQGGGGESGVDTSNGTPAMVGAALSLNVPEENRGARYRSTPLPAGLRLNTTTGELSGVPSIAGNYTVKVTPLDAKGVARAGVDFKINVAPIAGGVVGKFVGLVARSATVNSNLGGMVQVTTTAAGVYTGRFYTGTKSFPIKGKLGLQAANPNGATITVALPQAGNGNLLELRFESSTQSFWGSVSNKGESAQVSGVRTPWSAALPANALRGAYTFRLAPEEGQIGVPEGFGSGRASVIASSGVTSISGTLADGSKVSASTVLGKDGELAVYCAASSISLAGWLSLETVDASQATNQARGRLSWLKPAGTGTVYAAGFGPVNLQVEGGTPAIVPPRGLVLGLETLSASNPANAKLIFSGGGRWSHPLGVVFEHYSRTDSRGLVEYEPIFPPQSRTAQRKRRCDWGGSAGMVSSSVGWHGVVPKPDRQFLGGSQPGLKKDRSF
jgi:hypothetical protein